MTRWKTSEPYWIIYEALRAGNIVQWPAKYVGDPVVWSLALRLGKKKTSFIRAKRYVTNVIRDTLQSLLRSRMVHVLIYELLNSNNLVLPPWYFEKIQFSKNMLYPWRKEKQRIGKQLHDTLAGQSSTQLLNMLTKKTTHTRTVK